MEDSDERLAALLQSDPQRGYAQLVDEYLGFVYKIVYSKLSGTASLEDIEEQVCDIFYEFYCSRERIDLEKGSIKAFLSVFAKRRAINLFHKMKGQGESSLYDDSLQGILADHKDAEQQFLEAEQKEELMAAIHALGIPDSQIIIRKHYLGQTLREISMDMDMKVKTAEKRYERALKKLKRMLGGMKYE